MSRLQNSFQSYPNPENSSLGPKKVKKDPKIKSISNVRIEETIENKSFSTTGVDPRTVFDPTPVPINSLKVKRTPNLS